ncbi:MAG: hypothetical protein OXF02_01410 [Simkaniaceae bacterium]|nr:hypothetical protein [Simkaniaceae bacterium]
MSCFGCCKGSRSGSPAEIVGERETKCTFLGEDVSERIMGMVGDAFDPDDKPLSIAVPAEGRTMALCQCTFLGEDVSERIMGMVRGTFDPDDKLLSIAVPAKGRTMVFCQRSGSYVRQGASKLPARVATPSLPPEDGLAPVPGSDEPLAEAGREKFSAEKPASTNPETQDVDGRTETSATNRPPVPVAPPTVPCTEGEGIGQSENTVVNEGGRVDALTIGVLKRSEVEALKALVKQFVRDNSA